MNKKYIISVDQGTTSSRAVLFDRSAKIIAIEQQEFTQHYPQAGWVEHDPEEIWQTQQSVLDALVQGAVSDVDLVAGIGITNQRETTVVWNADTGEAIYNAIVWQDRRTAERCDTLRNEGFANVIQEKTGLVLDAYFSGTKIAWILDVVPNARKLASEGKLRFGTIDSWLIWKLTNGVVHATDPSNASRTMLFNIHTGEWDSQLCEILNVPMNMLPTVRNNADDFGSYSISGTELPICGVAGDQQAALFGQACFGKGDVKNTYGTGCFTLINSGQEALKSRHGLLTTVAWCLNGEMTYALEGSVFVAGAAIQWLRDELQIIDDAGDSEALALQAKDDEVVVVPAFVGLGAPHWDSYARGAIFGLTRGSGRAEIAKATLQSLAYQSHDLIDAMARDLGKPVTAIKVDGGAINNNYLAQFQADIADLDVIRPSITESTALGAAFLAGLHIGFWKIDELSSLNAVDRTFAPSMKQDDRVGLIARWHRAVERSKQWLSEDSSL